MKKKKKKVIAQLRIIIASNCLNINKSELFQNIIQFCEILILIISILKLYLLFAIFFRRKKFFKYEQTFSGIFSFLIINHKKANQANHS